MQLVHVFETVRGLQAALKDLDRHVARLRRDRRQQQIIGPFGHIHIASGTKGQRAFTPAVVARQFLTVRPHVDAQGARIAADHTTGHAGRARSHQQHVACTAQHGNPANGVNAVVAALSQDGPGGFQTHAATCGDATDFEIVEITHTQVTCSCEHHVASAVDRHVTGGTDVHVVPDLQHHTDDFVSVFNPLALGDLLNTVGRLQQLHVRRCDLAGINQSPTIHHETARAGQIEGDGIAHPFIALVLHRHHITRRSLGHHGTQVFAL